MMKNKMLVYILISLTMVFCYQYGNAIVKDLNPTGVSTLAALTDVSVGSVADGEVLTYASGTGLWGGSAAGSGDMMKAAVDDSIIAYLTRAPVDSTYIVGISVGDIVNGSNGFLIKDDAADSTIAYLTRAPVDSTYIVGISVTDIVNGSNGFRLKSVGIDSSDVGAGALSVTDITNGSNGFSLKTGDAAIVTTGTVATGTWASNITLGANEYIDAGTPSALTTTQYTAFERATFTAGYTTAIGDIVYLNKDGKLHGADADSSYSTSSLMGVALEAKNDTEACLVMLKGFIDLAAYSFGDSIGRAVYVSTTVEVPTVVVPSTGKFLRVIGKAYDATTLYFNPDELWGEVQ